MKKDLEKRARQLYKYLGIDPSCIDSDYTNHFLTENHGRDCEDYLSYFDGNENAVIELNSGKITDDEYFIESNFC